MSKFDEAYTRLQSWSRSLNWVIKRMRPQINDVLNPRSSLLPGCPSRAAMALLIFRDVEKKLREVNGAAVDVARALWAITT